MRGSDAIDVGSELLPRRLVRVLLWLVLGAYVLGWHEPINWYIRDKTVGIAEVYTTAVLASFEVAPTPTPAR